MKSKEAVAEMIEVKDRKLSENSKGKAAVREKRAQSLEAMGLVTREGSRYYVRTAASRGRQESYEVWRDENGRVRCSCPEFERVSVDSPAFRCEHILAIKYSLAPNREEQDAGAPADAGRDACAPRPTTNEEEHDMNGEERDMNIEEKETTQLVQTEGAATEAEARQSAEARRSAEARQSVEAEARQSAEAPRAGQVVPLAFANLLRAL